MDEHQCHIEHVSSFCSSSPWLSWRLLTDCLLVVGGGGTKAPSSLVRTKKAMPATITAAYTLGHNVLRKSTLQSSVCQSLPGMALQTIFVHLKLHSQGLPDFSSVSQAGSFLAAHELLAVSETFCDAQS